MGRDESMLREAEACFRFLYEQANDDRSRKGFGLVRDNTGPTNPAASIASVGFALAGLPVAVERGWIDHAGAETRAVGTLRTLAEGLEQIHGFFYHFMDMKTGARHGASEVSIIDTALCLAGALVAGTYFGGETGERADAVYARVDWPWYRNAEANRFYMGFREEEGGHRGGWNHYAEQLMMYILGAGAPDHPVPGSMMYSFDRWKGSWGGGEEFIYSHANSLFVHQYSHAFVDFRGMRDREGVAWFDNSVAATRTSHAYCSENPEGWKTFGPESWGPTACASPRGYSGAFGSPPWGVGHSRNDGTIAPAGALGSMPFTPEESAAALVHYQGIEALSGPYGLLDSYNLDVEGGWFAPGVIGIDKGISLLMIENHLSGMIWELFMQHPAVRRGLAACGVAGATASPGPDEGRGGREGARE